MPNTHIRDLDDDLLADYRAEARANGRSLQAELRDGLKRGRPKRKLTAEELLALSKSLMGGQPVGSDSTSYFRWLRDTDDGRYIGRDRGR